MADCSQEWMRLLDSTLAVVTLSINVWQSHKINQTDGTKKEISKIIHSLVDQMDRLDK